MEDVARQSDLTHRILSMLADQPGLPLEQLLDRCPDTTWNQVFAVVDHLSRSGDIRLTAKGAGRYCVDLRAVQHRPEPMNSLRLAGSSSRDERPQRSVSE
jgi:hypothetical protein